MWYRRFLKNAKFLAIHRDTRLRDRGNKGTHNVRALINPEIFWMAFKGFGLKRCYHHNPCHNDNRAEHYMQGYLFMLLEEQVAV